MCDILPPFFGKDGHLYHHSNLIIKLIHKLFQVFLFLQSRIESHSPAFPDDFVTPATPAGTMGRLSKTECTYLPTYLSLMN